MLGSSQGGAAGEPHQSADCLCFLPPPPRRQPGLICWRGNQRPPVELGAHLPSPCPCWSSPRSGVIIRAMRQLASWLRHRVLMLPYCSQSPSPPLRGLVRNLNKQSTLTGYIRISGVGWRHWYHVSRSLGYLSDRGGRSRGPVLHSYCRDSPGSNKKQPMLCIILF